MREIIQYTQITRVPMMQSFIAGITNIRGNVIPVIDLSDRLGMGRSPIDKKTCVITFEADIGGEAAEVGMIIDVVDQVYELGRNQRLDSPEFGSKVRKKFIQMMAKIDTRFITVLDIQGLLNLDEISKVVQKTTLRG